ncbi:MAG: hypothetical protein HFE94_08510 [Acutalibacter sp.]|nr:hypothetical protein [Acutalibacter sp.]
MLVLVDIVAANYSDPDQTTLQEEKAAEQFLKAVEKEGGPQDVVIEAMPVQQEAREAALIRIRAEIMAGGGPDVFILGPANAITAEALFQFPKSAMANEIFLPLDEYIQSAQFMDWEKQTQVIMEAGRWEGSQQLLPMAFSFPVTVFRKADYDPQLSADMTWDDMRGSEDLCLQIAADYSFSGPAGGREYEPFTPLFGEGADYKESELLFTEEEMVKRVKETLDLSQQKESGKFDSVPEHYRTNTYVNFDDEEWQMDEFNHTSCLSQPIGKDEAITIVPCYNLQGGVTATISAYAGINRNTSRPEDAFFLVDLLLSKKQQTTSQIYRMICDKMFGIPVQADLLENNGNILGWSLTSENVEEFQSVLEHISVVRYRTPIDNHLIHVRSVFRFGSLEEKENEPQRDYQKMVQELQE